MDILCYTVVIFLYIRSRRQENLDLFCPKEVKNFDRCECDDGKGKYYVENKGRDTDTIRTLIKKCKKLAEIETMTVKWRRSFFIALFSTLVIYFAVLKRLPTSGLEFLQIIAIIFVVVYGFFSFYWFHYYRFPATFLKENLNRILKKTNYLKKGYPDKI